MTKPVTFNAETPYLHNCDPHLERNINMFKTRKSSTVFICKIAQIKHILYSMWVLLIGGSRWHLWINAGGKDTV